MKKALLMLTMLLVNLVGFAQTLSIGDDYDKTVAPGYEKFKEPVVTVKDGSSNTITNQYSIKYYISGQENVEEATMAVNSRKAKYTEDATTGTQVELLFGEVVFGKKAAGTVTIKVIATHKTNSTKLEKTYSVDIVAPTAEVTFSPAFPKEADVDVVNMFYGHEIKTDSYHTGMYISKITGSTAALPTPKIMYNGVDITSHYDIATAVSGGSDANYNNVIKNTITGKGENLKYAGQEINNLTEEQAKAAKPAETGVTLTYTFSRNSNATTYDPTIAKKVVSINFKTIPSEDLADGKLPVHLNLDLATFRQQNVTNNTDIDGDGTDDYVIHVYKYGSQNHTEQGKYQYDTPNPAVVTASGSAFPLYCARGTGGWGDFQLLYVVTDGNSDRNSYAGSTQLGTYYDDCGTLPFYAGGEITKAGESTGITVSADKFQTNKPGLVKVAVYGVLSKDDAYAYELKQLLQPKQDGEGHDLILKNQWGAEYIVYTDPVYFYIDVMKRIPTLSFDPDPSTLTFGTGDKIDMKNRFNVSGSINNNSNGIAGTLTWGANSNNFEDDHFAYTFFISDHAAQVIKVNNWPTNFTHVVDGHTVKDEAAWAKNEWTHPYTGEKFYGDQYSFRSYKTLTADDKIVKQAGGVKAIKGDKIVVNGDLVEITDANLETYQDHVLVAGDQIAGTTYNSTKGYGEAFEKWTITFEYAGQYDIEYTIRPWNHPRWDVGSDLVGTKTYTYNIQDKVNTELRLSYYETTTEKNTQWNFDEPTAKVVVTSSNNDVTDKFDLYYTISSTANTVDATYTITEESDIADHDGTYVVYKKDGEVILKVNKVTGEVYVGNIEQDVNIRVSATVKNIADAAKYNNPTDKVYTIHVKDLSGNAKWDIISTCKTVSPDERYADGKESQARFTDETWLQQMGRFHYIGAGSIIGGTQVKGVPGIMMTIGASGDDTWSATASPIADLPLCCNHESAPVIVESAEALGFDNGIPTKGTFYQFNPSASGMLTIDANIAAGSNVILAKKDSKTGEATVIEAHLVEVAKTSDATFTLPLVAGETYYVYNATTGALRLHGFKYEPKFLVSENTPVTSETTASLFMNGFSSGIPTIVAGKNENVDYVVTLDDVATTEYVDIDKDGQLTPKKMTIDASGNIFKLKVTATIHSTDEATFGDCTAKSTSYLLQIIDIPTFKIGDYEEYNNQNGIENGQKVRTTNIPTAITMTFSGWKDDDGKYGTKNLEDQWSYKSAAGENSRIGSELEDDDPYYNQTIDGFGYYNAGNQNPVDENNTGALNKNDSDKGGNGNSYTYASGTEAEQNTTTYYNTTYRLPARGAFVKFEPEESGMLLVYLVQNGSVDYHHGITNIEKQYQLKWRPLYITDETGKPVEMVDALDENVKKYLPTGTDAKDHIGYYTRGISRCNEIEPAIEEVMNSVSTKQVLSGCSFDWTEFRGTDADKTALMAAWPAKGEREDIIKLQNGGFALPHKAYVRYAFNVKAGKTYFVFQPGSKFEFGGFSFVPTGYPTASKYGLTWENKTSADMMKWTGTANGSNQENNQYMDGSFTWAGVETFTEDKQNCNIKINDCRASDYTGSSHYNIERQFTAGIWSSICLPFSVSEKQCKELFGDGYILVTCDGVNAKDQLHFVRHANQYIEAGRPYFVKPSKNGVFAFHNVTIEGDATVSSVARISDKLVDPSRFNVDISDNEFTFKGIYKRETIPAGSFFMLTDIPGNGDKADGLYKYSADYKIGGYRAYFAISPAPSPQASAKAFSIAVEDRRNGNIEDENTTTGIIVVNSNDEIRTFDNNAALYNINGQKVGENAKSLNGANKGIYIINGKKIVVR